MHLVKTGALARSKTQLGGVVGWVVDCWRALQLGATARHRLRPRMQVVETLAIGGRKQLLLVSCAGERFLVGTGADSVQTIVRIHAEVEAPKIPSVRGLGELV